MELYDQFFDLFKPLPSKNSQIIEGRYILHLRIYDLIYGTPGPVCREFTAHQFYVS